MKILYDNTIFNLQRYGGISRYFTEIIRRIEEDKDVGVSLFKGMDILPYRFLNLNNPFLNHKLSNPKCDIYHPTYYSSMVKRRKGVKTIVTVYDMIHELYLSKIDDLNKDLEVKRKSIHNADHIICISEKTKQDLQEIYKIKDDSVSVVYFGSYVDSLKQEGEGFRQPDKPYIFYVGKRSHYKNFRVLVQAFNSLGLKKKFDLICSGGGPFSKQELSEFRRMKLEDSIKYVAGPNEFLYLYYKNAVFLVYPSLYEGFGLPILEAMGNDCAVIAANAGSIPEVAGDSALLFSPEDVDELCHCMKTFLNNDSVRNDYIKRGKERVKLFSWDKTAKDTLEVYKKS